MLNTELPNPAHAALDLYATPELVLTLVEPEELRALRVPRLGLEVQRRGLHWMHLPIADFGVPAEPFERAWVAQGAEIRALLAQLPDDKRARAESAFADAGTDFTKLSGVLARLKTTLSSN